MVAFWLSVALLMLIAIGGLVLVLTVEHYDHKRAQLAEREAELQAAWDTFRAVLRIRFIGRQAREAIRAEVERQQRLDSHGRRSD